MRSSLALWALGSLAGALVVALPDSDDRVLSFSRTHGPSLVDLIGVGILIAAWLPVAALLWSARAAVRGAAAAGAAVLVAAGVPLLAVSITGDTGREWLLGAAMLIGAQLLALLTLARDDT